MDQGDPGLKPVVVTDLLNSKSGIWTYNNEHWGTSTEKDHEGRWRVVVEADAKVTVDLPPESKTRKTSGQGEWNGSRLTREQGTSFKTIISVTRKLRKQKPNN